MSILSDQFFRQMAANKVGIAEFSESDEFCGFRLYPRQQVLLKLFFLEEMEGWEEDVLSEWIRGEDGVAISPKVRERRDYLRDQGYSHFTEIQLIGGRRGSKGFMTALAMAKVMYEVQQIPNPGEFFNVAKTKEIYFTCVAASLDQAKKFQFADLISVVSNCKPLLPNITSIMEEGFNIKTDADEELVRELRAEGVPVSRDYAKLRAKPLPANARSVRGATSLVSAQPLDAKVLTPTGWTTMGDISVGDLVVGSDGRAQRVLKIHEKGQQEIIRVSFSDGTETRCGEDHWWTLYSKRGVEHTRMAKDFMSERRLWSPNGKGGKTRYCRFTLPPSPVVEMPEAELPLDPYLVGYLIGDGNVTSRCPTAYCFEDDGPVTVLDALPDGYELSHPREGTYNIVKKERGTAPNLVKEALKEIGLWGHKSPDKFVPSQYKFSSESQRLALLQGLLDTDGSVLGSAVRFGTASPRLADDVCDIARSLGGYATTHFNKNTREGKGSFEVCISGLNAESLFRIRRKRDRAGQWSRWRKRNRGLVSMERTGEFAEMRCLTVENEDGLYITDGHIITHNCFDEFAHMMEGKSASTGSEVYNANKPSLAQFGKWGMLFLNSSPWAKTGKFYEQTEIGFALDEDGNPFNNSILTFQWPSWAIYKDYDKDPRKQRWSHAPIPNAVMANPDVPDEGQVCEDDIIKARELRLEEKANPESFNVEYRANWAEVMDGYFNPTAVDRAFSGLIHIPSKDIPGLEEDILRPVRMATNGSYNHEYRMHLDPSSTTAGYGMALGHVEEFPNPNFNGEMVSHVVIDFVKRWNPDDFPQGTIDPMEVSREVLHLIDIFRPSEVTYDQYQSDMPIQWLREEMQKKGIHETKVYKSQGNNRENWNKWETLKTAMNLGMFHVAPDCPDSDYAKQELKFLSCDRNKQNPVVDRQKTGPIQTKDMSDAQRDICYSFLGKFLFDIVSKRGNAEIRTGAQGGYQIGGRQQGGPQSMSSGRYDINDFYKDRSMRGGPSNPARGIRRSRR